MVKILSQAGASLADVYDVKGSIAGIDELSTRELPIVHEMGGTVFSERFNTDVRFITTGALNQNTTWDIVLSNLPAVPSRILGVLVLATTVSRLSVATLSVRSRVSGAENEVPIFAWDTNRGNVTARLVSNGAAPGSVNTLENSLDIATLPSMLAGDGEADSVNEVAFRGLTTGFGAGTVTATALVYLAFPELGGVSSRGLPVPSW